nr:hypothetical protein CFP56_43486 [Quercus suber]
MEAEATPQLDAAQQQQIQAFLANVEELTLNVRKEIDELKSAMKDKSEENLDGMIRRTDSPFTNEVLNCPSHQNSISHSWSRMAVPRIPWIISHHSKC